MTKSTLAFCVALCILCCYSCNQNKKTYDKLSIDIIPQPLELKLETGELSINKEQLSIFSRVTQLEKVIEKWREIFKFDQTLNSKSQVVNLHLNNTLEQDEYDLKISENGIDIEASSETGFFYALQSLKQIIDASSSKHVSLPFCTIKDKPRFNYRGMHLDVCRHFFSVKEVKEYIDLLAYHKFNYFHWHLTEDQGWRIEILKYPKLQEISAYRKETLIGHYNDQPHEFDEKRYGGYYTQEEVKEIVAFANDRYITVIPEIEMPGHAQAVLAAYPELGCNGGPYEVLTKWGISENVFCPYEKTFKFLEDVIDEVVELFPGPYIHIGGDECPKITWKESEFCQNLINEKNLKDEHGLQSYFITRMEKYINSKGKQIIGWDEILEGGLAPNASVMSWRGESGGISAAEQGHNVVMSPTSNCYFDYYQSEDENEPLAIGGMLPLKKVYEYEPVPENLSKENHKYIMGAQGNLWTEYIPDFDQLMYMAYPRACAMAEVNWTAKENKDYDSFIARLDTHLKRLDKKGINYADHRNEVKCTVLAGDGKCQTILESGAKDVQLKYWSNRNPKEILYTDSIALETCDTLYYAAFKKDQRVSKVYKKAFVQHKGIGAKYRLGRQPSEKYGAHGSAVAMNGIRANPQKFGDSEWLGFEGTNTSLIVDFKKEETISTIKMGFFNAPAYWIYPPKEIKISVSPDGRDWGQINQITALDGPIKRMPVAVDLEEVKTRYLLISIENFGLIPDGNDGAGHRAWLFMDEVEIY